VIPADITLTQMYSPNAGIQLFGSEVLVSAGTPAGIYHLVYGICENSNPTNCDTALVIIDIVAPAIEANIDYGAPVNNTSGGVSVMDVLGNDRLNGVAVVPSKVIISSISTSHPGITLSGQQCIGSGTGHPGRLLHADLPDL
jgi:large repetitive protein